MRIEEITIPMEEYKELLIIKGKYEEIRRMQKPLILYDAKENNIIFGDDTNATKPNNV